MPEFIMEGRSEPSFQTLDAFTQGYVEAMFFTESGEDNLGDTGFLDIAPEALGTIVKECLTFQREEVALLEQAQDRPGYTAARAGHDFWLTRNGHGAGYWDRGELEADGLGDKLTEACKKWSEASPYLGDDGKVWL